HAASISSLLLLLDLAGCARRISDANIEAVNRALQRKERDGRELSPKEVESMLGQPNRVETFKIPLETQHKLLNGTRYYYDQDGKTIVLHFIEDRLIAPATRFGEQPGEPLKP